MQNIATRSHFHARQATGRTFNVAFADQGYARDEPAQPALDEGIELQVIKLVEAKK
ncbi:hypothetical protein [Paraburkholderia fungorum]|uniref:hypothetical protein n=1 Tax=Paraburkholderia fungorum TaxID=134537 RepID=UPI0038B97CC2